MIMTPLMTTRFTKITNGLASLDDAIDNDQNIRKVIRALLHSWEVKATKLKELNDKEEMELIDLIGNLNTHEMERKAREEMESLLRNLGLKTQKFATLPWPPPPSLIRMTKVVLILNYIEA